MNKAFKYILLLSFCFGQFTSTAQQKKIDSLLLLLNKNKEGTNKINNLLVLAKLYSKLYPDTAIYYAEQAKTIAEKTKTTYYLAKAYGALGRGNYLKNDYIKALDFYLNALKGFEALGNYNYVAGTLGNIGNIYLDQADYPKAIDYFLKAQRIYENLNSKDGIASMLGNIGIVYRNQGNYSKALSNFFTALKIKEKLGDKFGMSLCLNNIGIVYHDQADFPKALEFYFRTLKIGEELEDNYGIAKALGHIGIIYFNQGENQKALDYLFRALEINEAIGGKGEIAKNLGSIGDLYLKTGEFVKAEIKLKKTISILEDIGEPYFLRKGEESLSRLYDTTGQYKLALIHFKKAMALKDTIFNQEKEKDLTRKEMNFEFERKESLAKTEQEKKDAVTASENKRQKIILGSVVLSLLLLGVILIVVIRSLRVTRKQKEIIEKQKEIVDEQKKTVEEKHKEITDSINYAEQIQRSFLATKELLDKNLNDYFVFFRPKDVVSGDFYWASELSNGNFAFSVADSTGHGVPGAIMSILNISGLEKSIENYSEPDAILNETRKIIVERLKKDGSEEGGKDGMDCSLLIMDPNRKDLKFSAANNPVLIIRNKEIIEFKPDKMPVGKHDKDKESFTLQATTLERGDVIYTLTDGFPDQFGGGKGKKYMIRNLKTFFLSISDLPMPDQQKKLTEEFLSWKGDLEQVDDVCIIGVRV